MHRSYKLNGNFIVCSRYSEQRDVESVGGVLLYNRVEDGFQKLNWFRIDEIHLDHPTDFPFHVGDVVVSASNGTVLAFGGKRQWLFNPEHIMARIVQ